MFTLFSLIVLINLINARIGHPSPSQSSALLDWLSEEPLVNLCRHLQTKLAQTKPTLPATGGAETSHHAANNQRMEYFLIFHFSSRVPQLKLSVSGKLEINGGRVLLTLWLDSNTLPRSGENSVYFKLRSPECWCEWSQWLRVTSYKQRPITGRVVLPYMAISDSSLTYKYQILQERCHTATLSNCQPN